MTEVIVVGAGPAGNQVAHALSVRGRSVTVLDSRVRVGDKLCTGVIGRECAERYAVPPGLVYHRARSACLHPPLGEPTVIEREDVQALVIDRVRFVAVIAERARAAGAVYRLGRKVIDIDIRPGGVTVFARHNGRAERYDAQAVVIATGFGSKLARRVGLEPTRAHALAAQRPLRIDNLEGVQVYARRGLPQGYYGWLVPTEPGYALAGALGRKRPGDALEGLLSRLQSEGVKLEYAGPRRVWGVPLKPAPQTFGDRVLLAGDVAGHVKPTTGGGIYFALRAGDTGAEVLDRCLARGDLSAAALSEYESLWKAQLGRELRLGYVTRLVYERLGERELDTVLGVATSNGFLNGDFSFDWHGDLIVKALSSRLFNGIIGRLSAIGGRIGGGNGR